jgi:hypothetical protein
MSCPGLGYTVTPGKYRVTVSTAGAALIDASDASFTIGAGTAFIPTYSINSMTGNQPYYTRNSSTGLSTIDVTIGTDESDKPATSANGYTLSATVYSAGDMSFTSPRNATMASYDSALGKWRAVLGTSVLPGSYTLRFVLSCPGVGYGASTCNQTGSRAGDNIKTWPFMVNQ